MADGQLIRNLLPFERNFTTIPNGFLRDAKLSPKALGILAIVMSHNHGWKIGISTLAADRKVGVDYIRTGLDELVTHGYLIRRRTRIGVGDDWELADPSGLSDPALIGYNEVREPVDNSTLENPTWESTRGKIQRATRGKIQQLKEDQLRIRELPKSTTDEPVDNSDAYGGDLQRANATPKTCVNGHLIIGISGGDVPFCALACRPLKLVEAQS